MAAGLAAEARLETDTGALTFRPAHPSACEARRVRIARRDSLRRMEAMAGGGDTLSCREGSLGSRRAFLWLSAMRGSVQGWLGNGQGIQEQVFRKGVHRVPLMQPANATHVSVGCSALGGGFLTTSTWCDRRAIVLTLGGAFIAADPV